MPSDPINLADIRPKRGGCPICGRPAHDQFKPFCSKRCADVDLARWLNEAYRVPVRDEDGDEPAAGPDGEKKT
ncbi:DNA gyrase inhibitor YacG [Oleisolibacter albus]|uniref:DNA gyrase inhibitor YacG n=1 Tax=Oleisolibacter albus TaxID=2171757 RepID=UPI000DF37079|nr:DNA gyrase inhibitor YacG [Oleisolibacter albus]